VTGKLELEQEQEPPPLVCIEPAHIPIEGALPARALTRVEYRPNKTSLMTSRADQKAVRSRNTSAYIILVNFSDQTLTVPKSTVLGKAEEASEPLIGRIIQRKEPNSDSPLRPQRKKKNEALDRKLLNGKPDPLSRESIRQEQSKDVFRRRQNPGNYNSKSEFVDSDDVMYRRQQNGKHQLVVPQTLIQDDIRENHDPKYVAHPGIKRTYSLISLNYW